MGCVISIKAEGWSGLTAMALTDMVNSSWNAFVEASLLSHQLRDKMDNQ
jgi:hypothetical protein